jgi:hypothetical protein
MTIGYVVDDAMFRPDLRWHQGESPFMRRDDARQRVHGRISRNAKPRLDGLEDRLLLYATTGGAWSQPARVTFSFVPDGTSIGGPTSALYSSLNAQHPGWQTVFQQAAAVWEAVANVNLVLVGDNGVATGVGSYVQGDPNNGDIRISATPQGTGALAFTFLPPPLNGYPEAGDIVFNSSQNWTTTTGYDLLTVAIHEFGHALGLGHSEITTADMYAYYNGFKTYLTADDVAGAQAIYGPRQMTPISTATVTNATNYTSKATALDITSLLNPTTGQVTLNNLDITSAYSGNWFQVTAPASTTGSMNVVMQSIGLSELSPRVQIIDGSTGGSPTSPSTLRPAIPTTSRPFRPARAGSARETMHCKSTSGRPRCRRSRSRTRPSLTSLTTWAAVPRATSSGLPPLVVTATTRRGEARGRVRIKTPVRPSGSRPTMATG